MKKYSLDDDGIRIRLVKYLRPGSTVGHRYFCIMVHMVIQCPFLFLKNLIKWTIVKQYIINDKSRHCDQIVSYSIQILVRPQVSGCMLNQ